MTYQLTLTYKLTVLAAAVLIINTAPVFGKNSLPDQLPEAEDPQALPDGKAWEDSDNDGYADETEYEEGSDPFNADDVPVRENGGQKGEIQTKAAVPRSTCIGGFRNIAGRLCISFNPMLATRFYTAVENCQFFFRSRVASYGDLYFVYFNTGLDGLYNPNGRWIGPDLVSDDNALCGNRSITGNGDPDQNNFEGTCNKSNVRQYWCAYDLEP